MIAKIITGTNVRGLLQYLTSKDHEVITSNFVFPDLKPKEIAKEMRMIQELNYRCKKNLMHVVLSFSSQDQVNSKKLKNITEDFLEAFKAQKCMSISYRHFDRSHPHVHVVINKIKFDGTVLSDSFSHIRAKKICRKIEQIYDLQKVSNIGTENENICIQNLQKQVDLAIENSGTFEEFILRLERKKYRVLKGRGISFINTKNGTKIKGSAIGRSYSLANIEKRIIQTSESKEIQQILRSTKNKDRFIGR